MGFYDLFLEFNPILCNQEARIEGAISISQRCRTWDVYRHDFWQLSALRSLTQTLLPQIKIFAFQIRTLPTIGTPDPSINERANDRNQRAFCYGRLVGRKVNK
jgi:hypothetical protein